MKNIKQKLVLFIFLLISQALQLCAMNNNAMNNNNNNNNSISKLVSLLHEQIRAKNIDIVKTLITQNSFLVNQQEYASCNTPLHTAIAVESFEIIELLIQNRANVNKTRSMNMSPLHHLASKLYNSSFSTRTCKLLIQHGALINATNNKGKTALHLAASNANISLVKTLLECGADKTIKDNYNKTAVNCSKNSKIINIFTQEDTTSKIDNIKTTNDNKQSPQKRVRVDDFLPTLSPPKLQKVERLHELDIDEFDAIVVMKTFNVNYPINSSLLSDNKNVIASLNNNNLITIDKPNITNTNVHNNTNIMLPSKTSSSTINSLREVQNFSQYKIKTDDFGHTALYLAVAQENEQLVRQLLNCFINNPQLKQDVITTANRFNTTTLHVAAANGNCKITKTLVNSFTNQAEKQKFVMMQDKFGNTALHLAVGKNNLNIVHEILNCFKNLSSKQEFISTKNNAGKTALDIFRLCKDKEVIDFLEETLKMKIDDNNNNNYYNNGLFNRID